MHDPTVKHPYENQPKGAVLFEDLFVWLVVVQDHIDDTVTGLIHIDLLSFFVLGTVDRPVGPVRHTEGADDPDDPEQDGQNNDSPAKNGQYDVNRLKHRPDDQGQKDQNGGTQRHTRPVGFEGGFPVL